MIFDPLKKKALGFICDPKGKLPTLEHQMKVQYYTLAKTKKVTFGGEMGWNERDGGCGLKKNMKRLFAVLASYNTFWKFHNHAKASQEGQKRKSNKRLEREGIWQLCSLNSTKKNLILLNASPLTKEQGGNMGFVSHLAINLLKELNFLFISFLLCLNVYLFLRNTRMR